MKKLFIIIGKDAELEEVLVKKVANELNYNYQVEKIYNDDIRALKKMLALLEKDEIKDYSSYFVLYAGLNFRDFRDTLPCGNIDALLLIRKLIEAVGSYKTEAEKTLVFDLFFGGISQVIKK